MFFLDTLAASPRHWYLETQGEIRGIGCPWTYFANREGCEGGFAGISPPLIWRAADNKKGHDPVVRQALLEACGLA